MGWMCPNCSNVNEESSVKCFACGVTRPSETTDAFPSTKGSVVFSDFAAWKESKKQFFRRICNPLRVKRSKADTSAPKKAAKLSKKKKSKKWAGSGDFAKPWEDHSIKFDVDIIKSKGYVRSERKELNCVKGYMFYRADGSSQFIRVEMVLIQKMAYKLER